MAAEEFIFIDNNWLKNRFGYLEIIKSPHYFTFQAALNLFLQNDGKIIVETGTQRLKDDPGGGSTTIFGAFCQKYGKRLYTVDNDIQHMEISRKVTSNFKDYITYVLMDSVKFLKRFRQPIDLLYLDSLDCPLPPADATIAQQHQLAELKAALPKLHQGSVVLLDDNNFANGGKTRLSKRFLLEQPDWCCILDHAQSLWVKK